MCTARSTPGGFSVNLFWPAPEKNDVQLNKRRKRRKRTKARNQVTISNTNPSAVPATNLPVCDQSEDQSKSIPSHERSHETTKTR